MFQDLEPKQNEVIPASTEWRIQQYHGQTHAHTDRQSDFLGFHESRKILVLNCSDIVV